MNKEKAATDSADFTDLIDGSIAERWMSVKFVESVAAF